MGGEGVIGVRALVRAARIGFLIDVLSIVPIGVLPENGLNAVELYVLIRQ